MISTPAPGGFPGFGRGTVDYYPGVGAADQSRCWRQECRAGWVRLQVGAKRSWGILLKNKKLSALDSFSELAIMKWAVQDSNL